MKIKFIKSNELEKPLRLSVHKSGKLGFTMEAAKALNLTQQKSIFIGQNEENQDDDCLYMAVNEGKEEGAFNVAKAGNYYYLPIKFLLEKLGIDYSQGSLAFNMDKIEDGGNIYFRLKRIMSKERNNTKDENEEFEIDDDL